MTREEILTLKGKRYELLLIIPNHDLHAGFGALLIYALNGIRRAEEINAIPIIDFNGQNCSYFFDADRGQDIWNYYFEKVSPYSLDQVNFWLEKKVLSKNEVQEITSEEAATTHQYDPERLATFWAWDIPQNKTLWMEDKRALGRQYVQKYIKPRGAILKKMEHLITAQFQENYIIGVHIRGTDFAYARPTPIEDYFKEIDQLVEAKNLDKFQLFVATDQEQYLQAFKQRYPNQIIYLNATRSPNHIAPFRIYNLNGYHKGEEVLLDMLLLSKCHHVLKGAAATGELALWFTQLEDITDFALQSAFNSKSYGKLESTYAQLNIGQKKSSYLSLHKFKERLVRRSIESRLGKALYTRFGWVRKLLRH